MNWKIFKTQDKSKVTFIIVSILLAGTILTVISGFPQSQNVETGKSRLDIYLNETENRLKKTISGISGAGKTEIFITTENTFETIYASNASIGESASGKTTQKSLAYSSGSSYSSEPVVVKELCPDIKGVLIVCEGGNNSKIKDEIINSVSIALGISKSKIYVTGGTN